MHIQVISITSPHTRKTTWWAIGKPLRSHMLYQWQQLTAVEVDNAGPSRSRLAELVAKKYGIASICVENYLRNFERNMPL